MIEFFDRFQNDDDCLQFIFNSKYADLAICPKCNSETTFVKAKRKKCYRCKFCLHEIYPLVGTLMEDHNSPRKWFIAAYLMLMLTNGVSAKNASDLLNGAYRTVYLMMQSIRAHMNDKDDMLCGIVECDETVIGRKGRKAKKTDKKVNTERAKQKLNTDFTVFGVVEKGYRGRVRTFLVARNPDAEILVPLIKSNVKRGSAVHTDYNGAYYHLNKEGYLHRKVCHKHYEWCTGWISTNKIESIWSRNKRIIKATNITVTEKHAQKYLNELDYRYNNRKDKRTALEELLHVLIFTNRHAPDLHPTLSSDHSPNHPK